MADLKSLMNLVKTILEQDELARNSDNYLYFQVLKAYAEAHGEHIQGLNLASFLLHMNEWGYPPFESVRRARQKLQAAFPELGSSEKVNAYREANEVDYRAFALDKQVI